MPTSQSLSKSGNVLEVSARFGGTYELVAVSSLVYWADPDTQYGDRLQLHATASGQAQPPSL